MADFRMVLDPAMQQIVDVALGICSVTLLSPTDVLDQINTYIRSRTVARAPQKLLTIYTFACADWQKQPIYASPAPTLG
jgi:hypothetical protein